MAKKSKLAPAVVPEEPKVVSVIDDYAFLLNDNPEAINTMEPQAVLHAVLPRTANKTKIMPPGSSFADTWMLKYGNPLASVDAALSLIKQVAPHLSVGLAVHPTHCNAFLSHQEVAGTPAQLQTLPGCLMVALLEYLSAKEKQ